MFFVVLEFLAFACRGGAAPAGGRRRGRSSRTAARPGGRRGWARRSCWRWPAWPGCRPGLAGLFAKVTVVDALLDGELGLAGRVVAINAVIGLAYYVRVAAVPYAARSAPRWPTCAAEAAGLRPVATALWPGPPWQWPWASLPRSSSTP